MRIGIDFDNTIVCYDELFYRLALEEDLIAHEVPANKVSVRDHLRATGRARDWTRLQGIVYGPRIREAVPYIGFLEFARWANNTGHQLFIISHRTKVPSLGPNYDLHQAGRSWVEAHLRSETGLLIAAENVFFELEKKAKVERIRECLCDLFIDDLPEILRMDRFPLSSERILFDPSGYHLEAHPFVHARSWSDILVFSAQYDR